MLTLNNMAILKDIECKHVSLYIDLDKKLVYMILSLIAQSHVHNGEYSLLWHGWVFRFCIVCANLQPWSQQQHQRELGDGEAGETTAMAREEDGVPIDVGNNKGTQVWGRERS
jgi:hypothetical protein